MTLKTIDNLSDGLFVDWEILNKLIYNIKQVDADVPTVLLHTTASANSNAQINFKNKGPSSTKMSIEAGRKKFTNVKGDGKVIPISTSIDGGMPCVLTTIEGVGTGTMTSYVTNVNRSGFKINLKNSSSAGKTGYVNWIVIRGTG